MRTSIGIIIGNSEILIEDIEEKAFTEQEGIKRLEKVRDSGKKTLDLLNGLLSQLAKKEP